MRTRFTVRYLVDDYLEAARVSRLHQSCVKKFGKDADMLLTNEQLVAEAFSRAEKRKEG